MKTALRIAIVSIALTAGLAVTGGSRAEAQVSFQGSFPLPHGSLSIAIGDPAFAVGAYVPVAYPVIARPGYGYGFGYRNAWIPARRYGSRWIVCEHPYQTGYAYGYRGYGGYPGYGGYGHGGHGGHHGHDDDGGDGGCARHGDERHSDRDDRHEHGHRH